MRPCSGPENVAEIDPLRPWHLRFANRRFGNPRTWQQDVLLSSETLQNTAENAPKMDMLEAQCAWHEPSRRTMRPLEGTTLSIRILIADPICGHRLKMSRNRLLLNYLPIFIYSTLSRAGPYSVEFGPGTHKFWFEFCCRFYGGFFLFFLSPKKSTEKSPAKLTRKFVRKNSPRISAEAFSWRLGFDQGPLWTLLLFQL